MNAAMRLGAYGALLALVLGGGAAAGAAFGPEPDDTPPTQPGHSDDGDHGTEPSDTAEPAGLPGLMVTDRGYTLEPETTELSSTASEFRFRITGPDGSVVRQFTTEHDKELHLIVASRDLTRFAHVHPQRDDAGVWSVGLPALAAGPYRVFADFRAEDGPALTLGVDVTVPGDYQPPAAAEASSSTKVDGFEVELTGEPAAGADTLLVVRASRDGAPARLEPYLGANGHLVALRDGDLAYLHVHPEDGDRAAGEVPFTVHFPSAGRYRLFFDFQVDGVVRTADFTVDVTLQEAHR